MPAPISEFFPVELPTRQDASRFAGLALKVCVTPESLQSHVGSRRAVVFQPMLGEENQRAFVSAGAAQLIRRVDTSFTILPEPLNMAALPEGLGMIVGDNADVTAYSDSHRG